MADCTSERRSSSRILAVSGSLALLAAGVYGAETGSSTPPGTLKVTAVRFWSLGDLTRIAIEVSSDFKYRSDRLPNPDRLFFDIQGAKPAIAEGAMHTIAVGDSLVKQIRIAETQKGITRVVLDMEPHTPQASYTASQLTGPDRLVVEVRLGDKPAPPAGSSISGAQRLMDAPLSALAPDLAAPVPAHSNAAPPVLSEAISPVMAKPAPRAFIPPPETPKPPPPVLSREIGPGPAVTMPTPRPLPVLARTSLPPPPPARSTALSAAPPPPNPGKEIPQPAKTKGATEPSLTRVLGLKLGRVVIDAGHGGNDAGTRGSSGLLEKDVTLDVATRLGRLLQERLGSEVVYTRNDDSYVGLQERTQIANEHKADLFLSIHANSSPFKVVAGVETYYLNFTTSKTALDLAAKENAGSESSIFDLKDMLEKIAMKDKIDESREFANSIQNSMAVLAEKNNAAAKNRGIKKAPFVVLIGASMPSVLAEIGFLTNASDEALLRKPDHRQKIAEALYKGISSYADSLSHFTVAKRD